MKVKIVTLQPSQWCWRIFIGLLINSSFSFSAVSLKLLWSFLNLPHQSENKNHKQPHHSLAHANKYSFHNRRVEKNSWFCANNFAFYKLWKLWLKEQQQKHRRHHHRIFKNTTTTTTKRNLILLYFNTQWLWSYLLLLWHGGLEGMDGK